LMGRATCYKDLKLLNLLRFSDSMAEVLKLSEDGGIIINYRLMKVGTDYSFGYRGNNYVLRKTTDDKIKLLEVVEKVTKQPKLI